MSVKSPAYNKTIDLLRILAILAVVIIHTTTKTIQASSNDVVNFSFTLFLNQYFRYAVPMFFVISGFVLERNYKYKLSVINYYKKRLSKIFIPYVFWSLIYYFFIFKNQKESFLMDLTTGDASYQLYFIPALLIFYIMFPFLHKIYNIVFSRYLIAFLGIFQILLLSYDYYIKPVLTFQPLRVFLLNYIFFFMGLFIARNTKPTLDFVRKYKFLCFPLTFIFGIYIFLEGRDRYLRTLNYTSFYSQWRPSIFIYSILSVIIFYYLFQKLKLSEIIIKKISSMIFFVFFIHVAVLSWFWSIVGNRLFIALRAGFTGRLVFDPIFFFSVASLSFIGAFITRKIPFLSKITG